MRTVAYDESHTRQSQGIESGNARVWASYRRAQVGNIACGQQVIDIDKEALINDLVVCQDEDNWRGLHACLGVQGQQICLEVCHTIAAADCDLEDLIAA